MEEQPVLSATEPFLQPMQLFKKNISVNWHLLAFKHLKASQTSWPTRSTLKYCSAFVDTTLYTRHSLPSLSSTYRLLPCLSSFPTVSHLQRAASCSHVDFNSCSSQEVLRHNSSLTLLSIGTFLLYLESRPPPPSISTSTHACFSVGEHLAKMFKKPLSTYTPMLPTNAREKTISLPSRPGYCP